MINVDAKWMTWIKENLARGSHPAELAQIVADNFGFSIVKATAVVERAKTWQPSTNTAVASNSVTTSDSNKGQQARREWTMRSLDALKRLDEKYLTLERIDVPEFSTFLTQYYAANKPVVFQNAFSDWPAASWTPEHLAEIAGDKEVEVQTKRESNPRFEMDSISHKQKMPFSAYHQKVMEAQSSNDFYMTANNAKQNQSVFAPLFKDMQNFADGYFDEKQHLTRSFIWYGPKGNFTPLHHDETNNMFLQVYGRKKIWLVPALQSPLLYNDTAVFSPIDLRQIDDKKHPLAKQATPIELTLNPGDTLFIPIGWWHQVESLDVSISITMTNFNALNSFPLSN
jgi:hypothetical protein